MCLLVTIADKLYMSSVLQVQTILGLALTIGISLRVNVGVRFPFQVYVGGIYKVIIVEHDGEKASRFLHTIQNPLYVSHYTRTPICVV